MYPAGMTDYGIVMEAQGPKDLLRFARAFSEKYSRKIYLYRCGSELIFMYRRRIKGRIVGIVVKARSHRLSRDKQIYFSYHRNRILPRTVGGRVHAWRVGIMDIAKIDVPDLRDMMPPVESGRSRIPDWIRLVNVPSLEDIVDYAYYSRDVLIAEKLDNSATILMTGFLSGVFPKLDPFIFIFRGKYDVKVDKPAFIILDQPYKFVNRIGLRTMRFVVITNITRMLYYES